MSYVLGFCALVAIVFIPCILLELSSRSQKKEERAREASRPQWQKDLNKEILMLRKQREYEALLQESTREASTETTID
jgi:hypothetical protein